MLIFVLPHQFIARTCKQLSGKMKKGAIALSLVKGLNTPEPGKIGLISDIIKENLSCDVGVLMGANIANEVAAGSFCETTIGERLFCCHFEPLEYSELVIKVAICLFVLAQRPNRPPLSVLTSLVNVKLPLPSAHLLKSHLMQQSA